MEMQWKCVSQSVGLLCHCWLKLNILSTGGGSHWSRAVRRWQGRSTGCSMHTHTHRHTTNGLAPYSSRQWCCREMSVFKWPFLKFGQQQKHLFEEQGTYYANPKKGSPKMFIFLQLHFSTTLFSSMLGFLNRHDSMTVNTCVMSDLFWPVFFLTLASKSMFIGPKPTMWMEHLI